MNFIFKEFNIFTHTNSEKNMYYWEKFNFGIFKDLIDTNSDLKIRLNNCDIVSLKCVFKVKTWILTFKVIFTQE